MFEEQTYETILDRMLDRVSDDVDKREGSIIFDAVATSALELAQVYWELDNVLDESFADTSSREFLERRARERSTVPDEATYAIVKAVFEPSSLDISVGARFNLGEYNYAVTTKVSDGVYMMKCETAGAEPNIMLGEITPIEYIEGLTYGEITDITVLGEDEEVTEKFRERYFETYDDQSSNGNVAWYKVTLGALDGVGGVKVLRAWNGAGTVKCIIQNSDFGVPSTELVNTVQEQVDPTKNQGQGVGLAAIGHVVTIDGVTAETISVSISTTLESGITWGDVSSSIDSVIDKYFHELNESWEDIDNIIVRVSQIETRILNVAGVIDVGNTKINNSTSNYTVPSSKVAVRGAVTNG